jgi:acyl-CoA thioesterase-1
VTGRELLIDHIHLSDRGAAHIAELAANWLASTLRIPNRLINCGD